MNNEVLEIRNISAYTYNKTILKDINVSFTEGNVYGLFGHNGSGKSTIQRLIANLEQPMDGEIYIKGELNDINKFNNNVILIPDTIKLHMNLSIKANVEIISYNYEFNQQYFEKCLKSIDLTDDVIINQLSKGNQEMVQLMILLCCKASVYLLDEPFSAIDIYRRDFIQKLIIDCIINNPHSIIIITTHLINEIQNVINHLIYIDNGSIEINDSLENLLDTDQKLVDYLKNYFKEEIGYEQFI